VPYRGELLLRDQREHGVFVGDIKRPDAGGDGLRQRGAVLGVGLAQASASALGIDARGTGEVGDGEGSGGGSSGRGHCVSSLGFAPLRRFNDDIARRIPCLIVPYSSV